MDFNGLNRCFFLPQISTNFHKLFLLNLCELWKSEHSEHSEYSDIPHDHFT